MLDTDVFTAAEFLLGIRTTEAERAFMVADPDGRVGLAGRLDIAGRRPPLA